MNWFDPLVFSQLARFGGVGVLATVVHIAVGLAARNFFGFAPLLSNLAGFGVAVLVSYVGHARFTFGTTNSPFPQFLRFVFVAVFGLAVSTSTVWLLDIRLGLSFTVAMISVGFLVPVATYVALRFWVFETPA